MQLIIFRSPIVSFLFAARPAELVRLIEKENSKGFLREGMTLLAVITVEMGTVYEEVLVELYRS